MGDEQEPVLNGRALSELKVVELKEELGKRGLSKIGNKNVLYERLKEHLVGTVTVSDESEQESMVKPIADGSGSPSANPFVAEYLAKQQVALLAARKDAEAARRAVSTSDEQASSPQEKSPPVSRRSDAVKRSESEQLSGTPERRATRRSPRLGSPQKDHEKVSAGETNGKEALNDAERGNSSVSQSDGKQKSNRNETAQEVRADDKREIKLEGSESSQHVTEGSARRERSGEVTAEAVVEDVSDGTCGSVRLNEMSKKEPSEVHVDESEASSSSFSTPAEQLRQKDKSVELKTESTEVSSEIGRGSDVSAASPKLDASAAAAAETSLGRGAKGESSKNESVAKTSVKMVDEVGEMEIALIDGAKRDETCSENVSKEERMVSEHFTLKEASGSSSVMAARHPEEADDSSAKVENEEQKEEGDAKDVASLNSSDNSHASTAGWFCFAKYFGSGLTGPTNFT
ncbi:hypothetical protein Tcan_06054 [Toxocara canis]|uniref:SAP domain-containing protein n=1 Tax=Toxocara canis TaxID=6265 RepID=A0A0B2V0X5_TOXCA|nr:hypothetical protein Tcan_06054 [Toxocara canis]